jgi:hypothetical protein
VIVDNRGAQRRYTKNLIFFCPLFYDDWSLFFIVPREPPREMLREMNDSKASRGGSSLVVGFGRLRAASPRGPCAEGERERE